MQRSRFENSYVRLLSSEARRILPRIQTMSTCPTDPEAIIGGQRGVLMCSPNYLGLSNHPGVVASVPRRNSEIWRGDSRLRDSVRLHGTTPAG